MCVCVHVCICVLCTHFGCHWSGILHFELFEIVAMFTLQLAATCIYVIDICTCRCTHKLIIYCKYTRHILICNRGEEICIHTYVPHIYHIYMHMSLYKYSMWNQDHSKPLSEHARAYTSPNEYVFLAILQYSARSSFSEISTQVHSPEVSA